MEIVQTVTIKQCYPRFSLDLLDSLDNVFGNVTLWIITCDKGVSLRHIAHHRTYSGKGTCIFFHGHKKKWSKPTTWHDVWSNCRSCYIKDKWLQKFKGNLKRGIMFCDGNTIHAYVEDFCGNFICIDGCY